MARFSRLIFLGQEKVRADPDLRNKKTLDNLLKYLPILFF